MPLSDDKDEERRNSTPSVYAEPHRTQTVFIRHQDEVGAMAWNRRVRTRVKAFFKMKEDNGDAAEDEESTRPRKGVQYRLEATRRPVKSSWWRRILSCGGLCGWGSGLAAGINPNQKLAMYLHWMFRVNFVFLFCVMCIMFFALVIFFAGLITAAGTIDEQCVRVGDNSFAAEGTAFTDAFALSWTTFSTVGYGSTFPALGYQNDSRTNCFFINFICSLESLLGVLYSGFCGAILFGKVLRIQSHAQVLFSDPIVIRYGPGVKGENRVGGFESNNDHPSAKHPCPVLEFRIVNRLYNEIGGEIMDATLNVVANVDTNDADPSRRGSNFELDTSGITENYPTSGYTHSDSGSSSRRGHGAEFTSSIHSISRLIDPLFSLARTHHAVEEDTTADPSTKRVNKQIFSKMHIEASDHPFFKRVWLARHILDDTSPLLKPRVRRQIRRSGGAWPQRLNTYATIRDSLKFNQILVSLNGVSNVSASDVYAQKIYDFVDVNIGYQFVNILYKDSEGRLGVDTDLINDVRQQSGGGGEPLILD